MSGALVLRFPGQYADSETGLFYNYYRSYQASQGRYTQNDPIGLAGGWNRFGYVEGNPIWLIDPLGLMGGSGSGAAHKKPPPVVSSFGCMGLMCVSGGAHNSGPQFSAELSFGGGIEICDAPPPPPPICPKPSVNAQPPGVPVPSGGTSRLTTRGGLFIGPAVKSDGSVCVRFGPHYSVPLVSSIDLGGGRGQ
jgi:RHS repeat-associated protein